MENATLREADKLEDMVTVYRTLGKDKCKILHVGRRLVLMPTDALGSNWLGSEP